MRLLGRKSSTRLIVQYLHAFEKNTLILVHKRMRNFTTRMMGSEGHATEVLLGKGLLSY